MLLKMWSVVSKSKGSTARAWLHGEVLFGFASASVDLL